MGLLFLSAVMPAAAQRPSGDISLQADYLPQRRDTAELRARVFAEQVFDPSPRLVVMLSGVAEGLLAGRPVPPLFDREGVSDAWLRVHEASVDLRGDRVDLLAGYTRIVWGRLDELQPTDVVNPLEVSRFFFEGRADARLPVALVRARVFLSDDASVEAVYVPFFRRGRFDRLDEPTSPFNLAADVRRPQAPPLQESEPADTLRNAQGGARVSITSGRVDWSVSAYRGFEPFPLFSASPGRLAGTFPRFTMLGGDFETVRGQWGIRGEVAAFVDDNFQDLGVGILGGHSLDAGAGVDRRAGDYRVSATVLLHRERYDVPVQQDFVPEEGRTDVTLAFSGDRSFARERYRLRAFAVYNPQERSSFLRAIGTWSARDNLAVEASGGWFAGDGRDTIGRFADSDFVYLRLKSYF